MSSAEISYRRRWVNDQEVLPTDWKFNGRPLVVIDPEDREQIERLARGWHAEREHAIRWEKLTQADRDESIRTQQAALRSLITPPRPDEPTGLGAVVEDQNGRLWVRATEDREPWCSSNYDNTDDFWRTYADITAVRILSEGVKP